MSAPTLQQRLNKLALDLECVNSAPEFFTRGAIRSGLNEAGVAFLDECASEMRNAAVEIDRLTARQNDKG